MNRKSESGDMNKSSKELFCERRNDSIWEGMWVKFVFFFKTEGCVCVFVCVDVSLEKKRFLIQMFLDRNTESLSNIRGQVDYTIHAHRCVGSFEGFGGVYGFLLTSSNFSVKQEARSKVINWEWGWEGCVGDLSREESVKELFTTCKMLSTLHRQYRGVPASLHSNPHSWLPKVLNWLMLWI